MVHLDTYKMVTLMTNALQQAADSFAKMVGMGIELQGPKLQIATDTTIGSESEVYVLTTEMKGDLHGKSYLLLTRKEVVWIIDQLAIQRVTNTEQLTVLQQASLLELDNILSAAAITQIADQLNIFCYGDVPALQKMNRSQMTDLLKGDEKGYSFALQAGYQSADHQLQATFIWMFELPNIHALSQVQG